jgi:hypothetical protein
VNVNYIHCCFVIIKDINYIKKHIHMDTIVKRVIHLQETEVIPV